jgi:FAD binding domain
MTITGTIELAGLDGGHHTLTSEQLEDLDSRVRGRLLVAGDQGWNDAVAIWNGMAARLPALVLQPASAHDVATAVSFARDHGLLLSVKGGGHNIAGTSMAPGGLTLDLSRMREIAVDPDAKLAHVGPGCLLGDVDQATQAHGLATVLGFVSETGVAGLTLGGGFGYLARRFGWTVDNLAEVEVVTADGRIRTANRDQHPELFWALRGGGGNFGVVTRFSFRLHQVGPTITGGLIIWSAERAADVLAAYRELTESAPRELTAAAIVRLAPPAPFLPQVWHGKPIAGIQVCHSGANPEADLAPVRALGNPIVDLVGPKPYVAVQSMLNVMEPKWLHRYWKAEFLPGLSSGFLERLPEQCAAGDLAAVPVGAVPPRRCAQRARGRRRGGRQPRRPLHRRVQRHLATRRPRRSACGLGPGWMGADPAVLDRRELRQLPAGRGRHRPDRRRLRRQLPAPPNREGHLRPGQPVPGQPQHPPSGALRAGSPDQTGS